MKPNNPINTLESNIQSSTCTMPAQRIGMRGKQEGTDMHSTRSIALSPAYRSLRDIRLDMALEAVSAQAEKEAAEHLALILTGAALAAVAALLLF
jgi:hypothetical protein